MTRLFSALAFLIFSTSAYALPSLPSRCQCSMQFEKRDGLRYWVDVGVGCPPAERRLELSCQGRASGGVVYATCRNTLNGRDRSNSSGYQWDARPVDHWARCTIY